jgi:transposase
MEERDARLVSISSEQRAAVEALLRRPTLNRRVRERAEMVKAAALGYEVTEIASWSGRSVRRVRYWLARFAALGEAGLADGVRRGRPVKADAAYRAALETAVITPPPHLGLPFDVWTSDRLSAYLTEQTGIRIAPGWLRALLSRQDFVTGRPKHTLKHLQDAAEIAAFEQELAEVGEKADRGTRPLRAASPG